jgi:hypothetical protein
MFLPDVQAQLHKLVESNHFIISQLPQTIVHATITPSQTSSGRETAYREFLQGLNLTAPKVIVSAPVEENEGVCAGFKFTFHWISQRDESLSYQPFCDAYNLFFAQSLTFSTAHSVSNGQNLMNQLLFETRLWSIRQYDVFNKKKGNVAFRGTVKGRTDIVILRQRRQFIGYILRNEVGFAIEVKTPGDMNGAKLNSAVREATIQVIGLCGDNCYTTPCVVLTDFSNKFFVVYLSLETRFPLKYEINIQKCSSIAAAINFAIVQSSNECISADFGRPDTPSESLA